MKNNIQTLKGFRDFLPEEMLQRNWLKNIIISVFEKWGYDPVETPTLEPLKLFEGMIGEDEKLFYTFKDPGGRDVALRYDQTVPICRVVSQYWQQLPTPFRRYQIQPAYRAENTQAGRYREFIQCDADIFGIEGAQADAEMIAMTLDIYRQIGFPKAVVKINDRELFKDMPYEAIVAIDKLEKIGRDGVIKDMLKKGIDEEKAKKYLNTVDNIEPNETIKTILNYLEALGFEKDWYEFDPSIARSFSYSSGPIWEVKIPGFSSGSVMGGERYDNLTEKISGIRIPATGFAIGFDRTLEAAQQFDLIPKLKTNSQVLLTNMEENQLTSYLKTVKALRQANIATELYPEPTKLGKQFKYADKKGIPWVVIIGEEESKQGKLTLKNMSNGEQSMVTTEEAIEKIAVLA